MANLIYKTKLSDTSRIGEQLKNTIDDIIKSNEGVRQIGLKAAETFEQKVREKYNTYLDSISSLEHEDSGIQTSITDTKKGYIVHVSGKNILYYEYGTGSEGAKRPHPRHDADGMRPYGSGRNIIHNGVKNNGKEVPYWYKLYRDFPGGTDFKRLPNDFNDGQIRITDYVWRHNGVITKGLPAGRFIYDSRRETSNITDDETLKKTINTTFNKKVVKKINRTVKKINADNKSKMRTISLEEIKIKMGVYD